MNEEVPISTKQTTVARAALETDYTVRKLHSVGQLVHNLHKIRRVLEKTNYLVRLTDTQLESGDPFVFSAILKFLVFRSSKQMRDLLEHREVSLQLEYLPDHKFIRQLAIITCELFKYRM